jgi:putative tricarboxylic transport membrane protein
MKGKEDRLIALALLGFSAFYLAFALRLKVGSLKNPGPGLVPIGIGGLLLFCTAWHFIRLWRKPIGESPEKEPGKGMNYWAVYGTLACTIVYPFVLEILKFILATTVVTFFLLFVLRPQRILSTFLLASAIVILSFWVFAILLGVALPSGLLEEFFFRWFG